MKLYLYEGLNTQDRASVMLWESAGRKLVEAQLTADQITQLFQQIQTAKGNRTLVGKGVDAGGAAAKAWNDLKSKLYNSGPMEGFAAAYDQAAEKLKQATGGDQGAMQYVQKYRDFAKKHPILQGFVYSALIAAAGISSAGLGGAAALALLKTADKALQGEDIRSALYSGAKTGALAYGASKLGDLIRGSQASNVPSDNTPADYSDSYQGYMIANEPVIPGQPLSQTQLTIMKMAMDQGKNTYPAEVMAQYAKQVGGVNESRNLSCKQVQAIFERVVKLNNRMLSEGRLEEGIWDDIKSGAGKGLQGIKSLAGRAAGVVAQGAAKVGRSMTANVSSDALTKAWQAAGSPTDSAEIEKLLQAQGVNPEVIKTVFQANSIPLSVAAAASTGSAGVDPTEPMPDVMSTNRVPAQPQAQPAQQQAAPIASRLPNVSNLTPAQKQQLLALVDKRLKELTALSAKTANSTAPVPTMAKISPAPKPGAPTPAEQAKLQQKIQAAMAQQT